MHEAAVRRSAASGAAGSGRRRRPPSSGLLPLVVLLAIVTAVSGVVLLLYAGNDTGNNAGGDPASREPERAISPSPTPECPIPSTHSPRVIRTVYQVGVERGVNRTVMLAAFEAGWVESHMRNLNCGDRDSIGVFQQRPSHGWGDPEQIRDVRYAATRFFQRAEHEYRRDPRGTAGNLAQRVQRSAYPERYDEAEPVARDLLAEARQLTGLSDPAEPK